MALWSAVVLLPKGNGDFRGVGLVEALWEVIEKIIDNRLTGSAIIEAKLLQQLTLMRQQVLYEASGCNSRLDRSKLMVIGLGGYM